MGTEGGVEKGRDVGADRGGPQTAETETALSGGQGGTGQRLGGRENTSRGRDQQGRSTASINIC